jgi:PilZ domain
MSRSSAPLRPFGRDPAALAIAERRLYPRVPLSLPGRFMRADKLDYPCRLKDISVVGAAFSTPTALTVGEKLIVYLLHLGGLEGFVVRRFEDGFAMSISATQRKREKLAAQVRRLSQQPNLAELEEREYPRMPGNEIFMLQLPDGTTLDCPMLDVSLNGVSIVAPIRPSIGTEVALANRRAVVVRHHDEGIAVEFVNPRLEQEAPFERFSQESGPQT